MTCQTLNCIMWSWVTHIAEEVLLCIPGCWLFARYLLGDAQYDEEMTAQEQRKSKEGKDTSIAGRERGRKTRLERIEGRVRGPSDRLFSQSQGKILWLLWEKNNSFWGTKGRWGCLVGRLYLHPLLWWGPSWVLLSWSWSSCVQLPWEVLRHCHQIHSHPPAGMVHKGGNPWICWLFGTFHCVVIVFMFASPTCL